MKAIIKLSSMGDIIHSLIVLPKLKEKVDFIVDESFKDILTYNPYINKIVSFPLRSAKRKKSLFFETLKKAKYINYDSIYDLQGLLKSAILARLMSKKVIGYVNPREKLASLFYCKRIKVKDNVAIRRYLNLFEMDDIEYLKNHPKLIFFKEKEFECLSKFKKNIVFIIGGSWECKKAPINIWIELAKYFKKENIIIPVSNDSEEKEAKEILKECSNVNIVKLNIEDLKSLISKSDLLIGNDTGPSFIAWANNVKNIILYGCTYNNKIIENKFSKSVELQKGIISKKLDNMSKMNVNMILRKIDEFK